MTNIPFLIIVIDEVDAGVGAVDAIVAVAHRNDAADGQVAADVGVRAVLEGVVKGSAVWAVGGRVVGK